MCAPRVSRAEIRYAIRNARNARVEARNDVIASLKLDAKPQALLEAALNSSPA
jgi:hypothetical protein